MASTTTAEADSPNFDIFRECLFAVVAEKAATPAPKKPKRAVSSKKSDVAAGSLPDDKEDPKQGDPSELADFSDYLATETFPSLPTSLTTLNHQTRQNDALASEKWSLPLTLSTLEEVTALIPPTVTDSLIAYGLVSPPASDTQSFFAGVLANYIAAATTPPPKWSETRTSACEICERDWVRLTYHHLIPREVHAKVLKRGWHEESQLNSVAWLCRACHSFVHSMASNEELAKQWFTVEQIMERDDVQKWAQWVGRVRWKKK